MDFNEGWLCKYERKEQTTELPVAVDVPKETQITLINRIPQEARNDTAIVFRSRMQEVKVYIEGELVYQYPETDLIGRGLPSVWNFVRLSEDDAGKEIQICLQSPYSAFSGRISGVRFGDYNDLVSDVISRQIFILRLSIMIGFIGVAIILISFLERRYRIYGWHRNLGLLLVIVSMWLCGESRMPSGKIGIETWYYLSMLSLLFCPSFLIAYLHERWKHIWEKVTLSLFWIFTVSAVLCVASEAAGGPDLAELLPVAHILTAAALVYTVLIQIRAVMSGTAAIRSEVFCLGLIALAGAVEIVQFYTTDRMVGLYIRMAILLYGLNLFRLSVVTLYRKVRENQELERKLSRSRAELVTSQIQPHFIYNTLNTIRYLISEDPEAARRTVYDFSTYLRSNLDSVKGRERIPFSDELRHIRAYLNIEKMRFQDRLKVEEDIEAKSFLVPPLSIEPLVENAVKHGICMKMEGGTVTIRSREETDAYIVQIEDDGRGFDVEAMQRKLEREYGESDADGSISDADEAREQRAEAGSHIGLVSIRFRVQEISGGSVRIESRPGAGTRVTVTFPKVS